MDRVTKLGLTWGFLVLGLPLLGAILAQHVNYRAALRIRQEQCQRAPAGCVDDRGRSNGPNSRD
jgi:hypothetical protein